MHGGEYKCTLAANDEDSHLYVYHGDVLAFDINQGLIAEFLVKVAVLPVANNAVFVGLASAENDDYTAIAEHALFVLNASADLDCETDDGTIDTDAGDTGLNWVAGTEKTLRIDMTDLADVKFFVDGVDYTSVAAVAAGKTVFDISAAGTGLVQPIFGVFKSGGAGVTAASIKEISIWADT